MGTIADMYRRVKKIDLRKEVPQIIRDSAAKIVEIQQEQMYQGLNAKGTKIFPGDRPPGAVYAPLTVFVKTHERTPPQPVDRVTLKDTGAFYKGMQVKNVNRESYELTSTSKKTAKLEDRYGEAIFGLDDESRAQLIDEEVLPRLRTYLEETAKL